MIFDWMDCAAVLSARNVLESETFRAFVINELTEEVLEQHAFTPLKNRLGQYEWVSDFCRFINNRSNVVQAGLWENGKWIIHGSSYQNRIWSTLKDIRVFTTSPDKDNWIKSTVIHSQVSLKATDEVHVVVRSERSGRRFELVKFQPLAKRLAASQWRADLVNHINTHSQYIKAGSSDDSKHVITTSAQTDGNYIWLPKGAGITASWYICERTAVADVVSGRNAFEKERITVFVVDDVSDQEREQITLETLAADTEMRTWTTALCKKVNGKSEYVKAGTYNESGQLSVISGSSYQNRIWTEHRDIRVFTTCPRLDNWEPIKPLLTDEVMTLDERVIVKVRSAATGRLCETLVFAPSKDRLKPALWMRDLSTLINEKSLYLRAGQANAEKELIETIADVYKSFIWAPKNSRLNVTWERCQLQPSVAIRSERNATENERVWLFVMDEATGKELERREYKTPKAHIGSRSGWVVDFSKMVNANSKLVRIGESFKEGQLEVISSGYKNRIWPLGKDLRAFTTSIGLENWVAARELSFETDLKANDRIVVHVRSELTGYLYQTLTFSPTLKDKKATAADWTKALCEKLNKECIYLKAGWKNEEKQIIEPVADHEKNVIWVPLNSGLTVEVLNIADKTRYTAPIEVQESVDPATGQLQAKIPFGTLVSNEGNGPALDFGLGWSSGHGWTLAGLSYMYCTGTLEDIKGAKGELSYTLYLANGTVKKFTAPADGKWSEIDFSDFVLLKKADNDEITLAHKNGIVEKLVRYSGHDAYVQPTFDLEVERILLDIKSMKFSNGKELVKLLSANTELFIGFLTTLSTFPAGAAIPSYLKSSIDCLLADDLYLSGGYQNQILENHVGTLKGIDGKSEGWRTIEGVKEKYGEFLAAYPHSVRLSVYLPTWIYNGLDARVYLRWHNDNDGAAITCLNTPVLSILRDISGSEAILWSERVEGGVVFKLNPELKEATSFQLRLAPGQVTLPIKGKNKSFNVQQTVSCVSTIKRITNAGTDEVALAYASKGSSTSLPLLSGITSRYKKHQFTYKDGKVVSDIEWPAGAPKITSTYLYEKDKTTLAVKWGGQERSTQLHHSNGEHTKKVQTQGECTTTSEYSSEKKKDNTIRLNTKITVKNGADTSEHKSSIAFDTYGNLVSKLENNIQTDWEYYPDARGSVDVPRRTEVENTSGVLGAIGWVIDHLNPFDSMNRKFGIPGMTHGVIYDIDKVEAPTLTEHPVNDLGNSIGLECLSDFYFFAKFVSTEWVRYTPPGDRTQDLSVKFHGYTALPSKLTVVDPLTTSPKYVTAIRPSMTLTILAPEIVRETKLSKYMPTPMTLEKTSYITDTDSDHFGRIRKRDFCHVDGKGNDIAATRHESTYDYAYAKGILITTVTEKIGEKHTTKSTSARNIFTGKQTSATDKHGNKTSWTYDDHGRLVSMVETPKGAKEGDKTQLHYHTFLKGHTVTVTVPGGDQHRVEYDLAGHTTKTWSRGAGFIGWRLMSRMEFDEKGQASVQTEYDYQPDGTLFSKQERRMHYDAAGNLLYTELPGGALAYCQHTLSKRQTLEYVKAGGKIQQKVLTTFDDRGHVTRRELQDGAGKVQSWAEYSLDKYARPITSKDSHGAEAAFTYDHLGRPRTITQCGIVTTNHYAEHSNLANKVEVKKGEEKAIELGSRTLDLLSRVTQTKVGGRTIDYHYKDLVALGKRTTATPKLADAFSKHSTGHSLTGHPQRGVVVEKHVVKDKEFSVTHGYSLRGTELYFINAFGQQTSYHYDACGRRIKALSDEVHSTFTYDDFGTLTGETVWRIAEHSSVKISFTHDVAGRETGRSFVIDDKHKLNLKYSYDKGRIKTAQLLNDTTSVSKEDYAYDEQGRLKTWTCDGTQRPTDPWLKEALKKQSFTYDVLGNIQTCISETTGTKKTNTATYAYSATDKAQLTKISHSEKSCAAIDLSYDADGRLSKSPVNLLDLHHNGDGRQVGLGEDGRGFYDSLGRRVHSDADFYGEWFFYNGNTPYAREGYVRIGDKKTCDKRATILLNKSSSCVAQQQTLSGGGELEINTFELKDIRGSVIASWRKDKEGFVFLPFTPYGFRESKEDDLHWLGFTGEPMDRQGGGIYHMGNGFRAYNPYTQVFQAPDNTGFSPFGKGGGNWYAYCAGDPVNLSDPSGHAAGRVISTRRDTSFQPLLNDPVFREIFTAVIGVALSPLAGGGAVITAGLAGIALLQGAAGVGAVLLSDGHPDASTGLRLLQGGLGVVDALASFGLAAKAEEAWHAGSTASRGQGVIAKSGGGHNSYPIIGGQNRVIGALYNNPNSSRLIIEGHGFPMDASMRVDMPQGSLMSFYANKGVMLKQQGQTGMEEAIINGARPGKPGKMNVPDYKLGPTTYENWHTLITGEQKVTKVRADIPKLVEDAYNDAVKNSDASIFRVFDSTSLGEIMEWLENHNTFKFTSIEGYFCRGTLPWTWSEASVKAARDYNLHYDRQLAKMFYASLGI